MVVHVEKIKERGTLNEGRGPSLRRAPPVCLSIRGPICKWPSVAERGGKKKFPSLACCFSPSLSLSFSLSVPMPLLSGIMLSDSTLKQERKGESGEDREGIMYRNQMINY